MTRDVPGISPREVLEFWFSEEAKKSWFEGSDAFDAECRERLGAAAEAAMSGAMDDWSGTAQGALALLILLDQVPRNIHRGTPAAFASDRKALAIAKDAIARGFDAATPSEQRNFLYLPFMHSEDLTDQERGVALYATNDVSDSLSWMKRHRDVIARFGRFPHRNETLGRTSTPEEEEFLRQPGSRF
jgi:uncharacterized protein (DUF924 family)